MNTSYSFLPVTKPEPRHALCACALLLLLSACGDSGTKKPLTQVAAKVNGEEISIHQVNVVMERVQAGKSVLPEQMRREVLDKLIEQQVLYSQAIDRKIDREPKVMMLVDAAKREIVARAYMDSLLAAQSKVTPAEVHQYYVENPALFAKRKIYTLEELTLPATPAVLETLNKMASDGESLEEVGRYLAGKKIEFKIDSGVRKAEQVQLDVLPRLAIVPDGKTALIESGKQYYVVRVVSSQFAPIDEAHARPHIEVFLGNQQAQRTVAQEVKRLKTNARIEYLGDFAQTVKAEGGDAVAALKPERMTQ